MDVGVIENQDGSVRIVVPAEGFTVQDNFDRLKETGVVVDRSMIPNSRVFRNAWVMNQAGNGVVADLEKVKEIIIAINEAVVDKQLKAIRPAFEEANDADDITAMSIIKSDRQNIRNTLVTRIAAINAATTEAEVLLFLP